MAAQRPGLPLSSELEPAYRRWLGPIVDILARVTAQSLKPLQRVTGSLTGDNAWRDATAVEAGWTATDGMFCKDENGVVRLRGSFANAGPLALPTTIYTLPEGYWPSTERHFAVPANGAFGEVSVSTAGAVALEVGDITLVYLDGVNFTAGDVMPRANRDATNAVRSKVNEMISRLERD